MNRDLVRARAASVLDALGDDFWAWWRTAMVAGLLAMLAGLLAMGTLAPSDSAWYLEMLFFVAVMLLGACATVVAHLAALRGRRWSSVHRERRLPVAQTRQRWDAVGTLVTGTLGWVALALWAVAAAVYANRDALAAALPWIATVLVIAGTAGAAGKAGETLLTQTLSVGLMLLIYVGLGPAMRLLQNIDAWTSMAAAIAAFGLVVWSFWRTPNIPRPASARSSGPHALWARIATPWSAWSAWGAQRSGAFFALAPLTLMSSVHLAKPYIDGQSQPGHAGLWLGYQLIVLAVVAFTWQVPAHHWRLQLSPRAARQRAWLAVRLWSAQCLLVLPLLALAPLVASPWMLAWPYGMSDAQVMLNTVSALPWLIANGALTLAAATLWVGIRRHRLAWDCIPFAGSLYALMTSFSFIGNNPKPRLDWAGRWDVLAVLLVTTAALLALASWAWSRGSLTGMERWSLTGRYPKR